MKSMLGILVSFLLLTMVAQAQSTSFTYQGRLTDGGNAANGNYDFLFSLFDASMGGAQIGSTLPRSNTAVANGIFTVQLDFLVSAFPGANRFLEISVRPAGSGSFTVLSPRQQINWTPYSIRTLSAATADTATNSTQLGGIAASQYVQTNDSRLSDPRAPTPGSANYIQNTTTQQTANFNVSGNGRIAGNLGIGSTNPTSKVEIAAQDGLAITGFQPFLTLRDTNSGGLRSIMAGGNGDFGFYPNSFIGGTPALIIKNNTGRVGIGTTNPTYSKLQAEGGADIGVYGNSSTAAGVYGSSSSDTGVYGRSDPGTGVYGYSNTGTGVSGFSNTGTGVRGSTATGYAGFFDGRVSIGTPTPNQVQLTVRSIPQLPPFAQVCFNQAGDILQCGGSSLKWKTNVHPLNMGLNVVRRLHPINFNWKEDGRPDIGLGAEDVAQVAPSLTFTNDKGEITGVKYEKLNLLLINAIKEQQKQIDEMRAENSKLRARLRAIEKRQRTNKQLHQ